MSNWPELSVERDHDTLAVLHLAAQMLGKLRVAHAPWVNHGWHVALQPNARGLGILPIRFSWGTAETAGRTLRDALDEADRNMYILKRARASESAPRERPPAR